MLNLEDLQAELAGAGLCPVESISLAEFLGGPEATGHVLFGPGAGRGAGRLFLRCIAEFAAFSILFAGFGMLAFTVGTNALDDPGGIPLDIIALLAGAVGLTVGGLAVHHVLSPGDHVVATVAAEARRWWLGRSGSRRPA